MLVIDKRPTRLSDGFANNTPIAPDDGLVQTVSANIALHGQSVSITLIVPEHLLGLIRQARAVDVNIEPAK